MRLLLLAAGLKMVALAAVAQSTQSPSMASDTAPGVGVVHGEITPTEYPPASLTVQLVPFGRGIPQRVEVNPDGSFDLRPAGPGLYEFTVTGPNGLTLFDERLNFLGSGLDMSIRLSPPPVTRQVSDATVSIRQLQHSVPSRAQNALNKGRSALFHGKTGEAERQFLKAVDIDPQFADAYNELGALYESMGELHEAANEFQAAIDLVPDHRLALSNLCVTLVKLERFGEASLVARRAVQVDPANAKVHYMLAVSLLKEHGASTEVLEHLQRAETDVPIAHVIAAQILMSTGKRTEARRHLEEYLHNSPPNEAHRSAVEGLFRQLNE